MGRVGIHHQKNNDNIDIFGQKVHILGPGGPGGARGGQGGRLSSPKSSDSRGGKGKRAFRPPFRAALRSNTGSPHSLILKIKDQIKSFWSQFGSKSGLWAEKCKKSWFWDAKCRIWGAGGQGADKIWILSWKSALWAENEGNRGWGLRLLISILNIGVRSNTLDRSRGRRILGFLTKF